MVPLYVMSFTIHECLFLPPGFITCLWQITGRDICPFLMIGYPEEVKSWLTRKQFSLLILSSRNLKEKYRQTPFSSIAVLKAIYSFMYLASAWGWHSNWSIVFQVDDKYQYTSENKDNKVHGWICFDPPVGFWQITPSNEFRNGGPFKQDLTSHVNPTTLAVSKCHRGRVPVK